MTGTETKTRARIRLANSNISRLHHRGYVSDDMEATRHFYEDVIGLPLIATFCVVHESAGDWCQTLFELTDGSALTFFSFANPETHKLYRWRPVSFVDHIALKVDEATQMAIRERLIKDGRKPEDVAIVGEGASASLYVTDPDGNTIEFCRDIMSFDEMAAKQKSDAHSELKRWLAGDHTPSLL